MSGINELGVILLIVAAIIVAPRIRAKSVARRSTPIDNKRFRVASLSVLMRFLLIISLIWPLVTAMWLKPWQDDPSPFLGLGLLPIIIIWSGFWIIRGGKKRRG